MSSKETISSKTSAFIERFVESCGSSQPADIARSLNISYQAAKNYLEGRLPDSSVLITIAEKTPYSIHWLLTGNGEKFSHPSLKENTPILTDQTKALIKDECQKVVGEILSVYMKDAQEKVIVIKPEDIKEEKKND